LVIIRGPLLAPVGQAVPDNCLRQAKPDLQVLCVRWLAFVDCRVVWTDW
jgi:hypothetical protein